MEIVSHSVDVSASAQVVWDKLVHWENWTTWDGGMEQVTFDGPIDVGSIGRLKVKGGPLVQLHISSLTEGKEYSDYFDMFGTRFTFHHEMTTVAAGVIRVHFSADAQGLTALIIGNITRPDLVKNCPKWMDEFKRQRESAESIVL